ncbi:MAG: MerR family transcriptional regulator [Candidatus Kapabacteria bacterium]|jgi:DNA-binding transcriptional MerR regulator|nr:MerR family transcriptional regulator [Candidatus Kapabacteria bacterium]
MRSIIQKLYYSIAEVSKIVDEEQHVLRYWEREFPQLRPQKNRAGNRVYTSRDLATLRVIKRLLREERYTVAGAKDYLRNHDVLSMLEDEETPDASTSGHHDTGTPDRDHQQTDPGGQAHEAREVVEELRSIASAIRSATQRQEA